MMKISIFNIMKEKLKKFCPPIRCIALASSLIDFYKYSTQCGSHVCALIKKLMLFRINILMNIHVGGIKLIKSSRV